MVASSPMSTPKMCSIEVLICRRYAPHVPATQLCAHHADADHGRQVIHPEHRVHQSVDQARVAAAGMSPRHGRPEHDQ